ncbi:MAG TPA: response regulator [Spirochaetota bacterium]|nr:response regulator [Spirochaetota bacterium]
MTKQAILCVDDEAIIVMSLSQEIRSHFHDRFIYETALSAEEAFSIIDELTKEGIRLIMVISDWLMPGMKGDEFLSVVRQTHPDTKTLLVTGHAPREVIEKMKDDAIVNAILIKPWTTAGLIKAISEVVDAPQNENTSGEPSGEIR